MIIAIILLILSFPSLATAACHLYILPSVGLGELGSLETPKYVANIGANWSGARFGAQGIYIVAADVSNAVDTSAQAQSDVIRLPDNLDSTLGASLATVQKKLEAINIPGNWLTSGTTYRAGIRTIIRMGFVLQRFSTKSRLFTALITGSSVTLDTTFNSLSALRQQQILDTVASFNLSTDGFSGASTIRQILKGAVDQFANNPIRLGCVTI